MIVVDFDQTGITVDGHAGYAEQGKDIVCAAVSVLTQTLAISLDGLTNDRITLSQHEGHMRIDYKNLSERGQLLVDSFFIGICGVAESYPGYLKIAGRALSGRRDDHEV